MNKILSFFKYIGYIINILLMVFLFWWFEKFNILLVSTAIMNDYYPNKIFILVIILLVAYFILICLRSWHELGHLAFGRKAGLKFVCFYICGLEIYSDDEKIRIRKGAKIPGATAYCKMVAYDDKKYNVKDIKLFALGGIIFNIIAFLVSLVLMIIVNDLYMDSILMLNIGLHLYAVLYNIVPFELKSGIANDGLYYLSCVVDEQYFDKISKFQKIQSMLNDGTEMKDIDKKMFVKVDKARYRADVTEALFYVDYIVSKGKYNDAVKYIIEFRKENKGIISKNNDLLFRIQLINSYFYLDEFDSIKGLWDREVENYLVLLSRTSPIYSAINYMYYSLVEIDEYKKAMYLEQFNTIKDQINNDYLIKDSIKFIQEIEDKIKNSD